MLNDTRDNYPLISLPKTMTLNDLEALNKGKEINKAQKVLFLEGLQAYIEHTTSQGGRPEAALALYNTLEKKCS